MKRTRSNTKTISISTRSQKPFRDKTNENLLQSKCISNVKSVAKKVEASNKVPTTIYNTVRVSICRDAKTESKVKCLLNKISSEKLVSNTSDVYNFEYDPRLEPKRPVKKKKGRSKNKKNVGEIDTSGEPDNSMKPIVQRLRKMQKRKEKQNDTKAVEPSMIVDNSISTTTTENAVINKINKPFTNNSVIMPLAEKIPQIIEINKNIEIPASTSDQSIEKSVANELADIAKSFLEDLSDEDGDFIVTSPTHVDIISKMIMRKSNNPKLQNKIFNSTLNSSKVVSSPWRLNASSIRKKPQFFYVKDKSFTPSYNPDIGIRSTKDSSLSGSSIDLSNRINHKLNDTKITVNNKIQTSLCNFVTTSSEKQVKDKTSRGLFEDMASHNRSPARKCLGELNFNQPTSTPIKLNLMHSSHISPKKKNSDDSLFGFSFISDTDNLDISEIKENIPKRMSPQKQKITKFNIPTRISMNEIKNVILNEKPVAVSVEPQENRVEPVAEHVPSLFYDNIPVRLFDDPEEIFTNTKKICRQYTRKTLKRKRILSETSYRSDAESDEENVLPVIKKKNMRTKEEEIEAKRLAADRKSVV